MSKLLQAKPVNRGFDWRQATVTLGLAITRAWVMLLGYGRTGLCGTRFSLGTVGDPLYCTRRGENGCTATHVKIK
jgi:hypothetical protein